MLAQHTINRPNRGTVPFQKLKTPSSVAVRYAQCSAFRYSVLADSDCIRVLTTLECQLVVDYLDRIPAVSEMSRPPRCSGQSANVGRSAKTSQAHTSDRTDARLTQMASWCTR